MCLQIHWGIYSYMLECLGHLQFLGKEHVDKEKEEYVSHSVQVNAHTT